MILRFLLLLAAFICAPAAFAGTPFTLAAADGVQIHGETFPAQGAPKAIILLFHQAGSNRGEYAPIAPRLAANGFTALAIDQRSGGPRWGRDNQTAQALKRDPGYQAALPDLEATLAYARKSWPNLPIAIWGSSYSASLVFLLAAEHPDDVKAVLAFSPGEYFGGTKVAKAAAQVRAPVFVTSASSSDEVSAAQAILAASPATVKEQLRAKSGVHGSSTLRADSNPKGADENWVAVERFLTRAFSGAR